MKKPSFFYATKKKKKKKERHERLIYAQISNDLCVILISKARIFYPNKPGVLSGARQ